MTKETITRIVILLLALTNQVLAVMGKSPIPVDDVVFEQFISLGFTIAAALWAAWKDNDISKKAIERKEIMKEMGLD